MNDIDNVAGNAKGYMRIEQASDYLGVSKRTINNWRKNNGLRYIKVGGVIIYKISWIDEFLLSYESVD